ncbi:hypothetical protein [Methanolobus psychrotolerans]|uniref:hypothetical protein n=1 Tax=Methanolobus psychrotolerans TaxID=1874706 RepID=UPI000B9194F6|nr:hypothetical protein [Methanolobus psychrotolerans]
MKKNTILYSLVLAVLLAVSMLPATATSSETTELNDCVVKSYGDIKYASISEDFSNPLSLKDLDTIREQVVSEYKKEKGISEVPIIYSVPEVPEGEKL